MFTVTHSATRLIGIAALLRALPWAPKRGHIGDADERGCLVGSDEEHHPGHVGEDQRCGEAAEHDTERGHQS